MNFRQSQHPAPVSWGDFESLCLSLFREVWKYPLAQKNGRGGDKQHGVDIWAHLPDGRWVAIQCKGKDALYGHAVTGSELRTEITKALTFDPPLSSWTLVTSGPKNASVEAEARRISKEHQAQGLFEVHVMGWEDLRDLISGYPDVIEEHFPNVAPGLREMQRQVGELHAARFDPSQAGNPARPADLLGRKEDVAEGEDRFDPIVAARLRSTLGSASLQLLNWPTTVDERWFTRPELGTLIERVTAEQPKPLVVLGPPGAGKSALLAKLGNDLSGRGVVLLALKADSIPPRIASMAELDEFLDIPNPLDVCLRRLAIDQPVVLLIDQLDALADLMDQHGERLRVLLRLVAQVRDCPNLAIVLSCREFEFRHDARLTTLDAQAFTLQPVDWAEVEAVLRGRGLSPESWHPDFREVLRVPQHLEIFLRFLAHTDAFVTFGSYHEMLEEVFRRRVLTGGPGGEHNAAALYAVARAMGQDEDLWVPAAKFDGHTVAIARMEAAGFLRREGFRLGFRHQTLFDFVRARAFVTDGESVADYALARKGTIFARPTIWSALSYLRASDRQAYEREMQRIWSTGPRPHLRGLLRDLMGQQQDPGDEEARRLMPLLIDPSSRMRTLQAMTESQGWFRRLRPRIPALMLDPGGAGWFAANLLRSRVNEETEVVLAFMRAHWNGVDHHERVSRVLEELKDWTSDALDLAMIIAPGMNSFSVIRFAEKMPLPDLDIARFVLARLQTVELPSHAASMNFFQSPHVFPGLPELMLWHPDAFVRVLWTWVAGMADRLAAASHGQDTYRHDGAGMLARFGVNDVGSEGRLGIAFARTIAAWAAVDQAAFLEFADTVNGTDLGVLHCMLAEGYIVLAPHRPQAVLDYLVADPRRFRLGDLTDSDHVTRELITAAADHLDRKGTRQLIAAISRLENERALGHLEPARRRDFRQWDRQDRLRLLLAIPEAARPTEFEGFIREEIRAFGVPPPNRTIWTKHASETRMSGAAMCKARDKDIIRFLCPRSDPTGKTPPIDAHRFHDVDVSRAFGEFAKIDPPRALRLLDCLSGGELERSASEVLRVFSEEDLIPPVDMVALVVSLHERGLVSLSFRHSAAYALSKVAQPLHGLDNTVCAMLRTWLSDYEAPPVAEGERPEPGPSHAGPILWDTMGMRVLPGGNYPILRALELGTLSRAPLAADRWLEVLVEHAARPEDPAIWQFLSDDLRFLVHADRTHAVSFLGGLFENLSVMAYGVAGVRLLAWTQAWLPPHLIQKIVRRWMDHSWERGQQAAGEFVAYRHLMNPDDDWAAGILDDILGIAVPDGRDAFRLGVAYTAVETWSGGDLRDRATSLLERLSSSTSPEVAKAVGRVFLYASGKAWDTATDRVLRLTATWPALLSSYNHSLPQVLKEALRDGIDPFLVGHVALGLVKGAGEQVGNVGSGWAMSAEDFFELATALQRTDAMEAGMELFEAIFDAPIYTIDNAMRQFDRNRFG